MARAADFNRNVRLPPGLTLPAIRKSIEYIEKELADLVDIYYEQANVFSALVGIYRVRALDTFSVYEKSRHRDVAQQRFPDLNKRGSRIHRDLLGVRTSSPFLIETKTG